MRRRRLILELFTRSVLQHFQPLFRQTPPAGPKRRRSSLEAAGNFSMHFSFKLSALFTALLSAHAALAATPVYFDEKEDMQAYQAGIPISRKAMYSMYGLPEPEDEEDALTPPAQSPQIGGIGSAFNFADDVNSKKKLPLILLNGKSGR